MEAVGQLTGGIAHDFNNLLMVVMGNLQLVEQLVKPDERATKRIQAAMEATEKGSELTKRMLAFSRQQTLQNKELTVNSLLLKNHDMLRQAVGGMVEVKIMPGSDIWPIKADQTMLETAVLNLCINARDAMKPKGGSVIIETHNSIIEQSYAEHNEDVHAGDYVVIAVTDTGCGIPQGKYRKGLPAVLYHQGSGGGLRPWPVDDLRLRQAVGRPHQDLFGSGSWHFGEDVPAALKAERTAESGGHHRPPAPAGE